MIGQDSIQRILGSALHVSKAGETEARLVAEDLHLTRFANNLLLSDSMFAHGCRVPPIKVASFNFAGATQ